MSVNNNEVAMKEGSITTYQICQLEPLKMVVMMLLPFVKGKCVPDKCHVTSRYSQYSNDWKFIIHDMK